MKNIRFLIVLGLSLGLAKFASAAPCDSSTQCNDPAGNGTAGSWTASASGITGVQAANVGSGTQNVAGSRYFFAGVTTDQGASVNKSGLSPLGDGNTVIGSFALATSGPNVTGGVVSPLLGGLQNYVFYAQACPNTQTIGGALCSDWIRIGSKATLAYPSNVFATPVRPTDTTANTIAARTQVPAADVPTISQIEFEVDNLISGGLDQPGIIIGWPGANQSNILDSSLYTVGGGFLPNVKYRFIGKVYYPYGVAVPGAGETETNLWTRPVNPGTVSFSNVTHCSVQIDANNSSGAPANPAYTSYNLCASGAGGTCTLDQVSGGTPGDTASALVTNLNPNTSYTPQATAQVGNGDGTSSGWANSGTTSGPGFTTQAWDGTFTISNVFMTSATFSVSGITGAGSITSWVIRANGVTIASGSGDPTGSHTATGLIPNTVYGTVQIVLTETSGCSSTLNFSPTTFTTTPFAPTAGSINATAPRTLVANFTDSSANPSGATSTYELQACLTSGFTSCLTVTGPKAAGAAQSLTINTGVLPETQYFARVRTRNQSRPTWPDSSWFDLGSATTPNEVPTVNTASCSAPAGVPSASTCGGTATDNGPISELRCSWSATGPGTVTFTPSTPQTATGGSMPATCPDVTATFPVDGAYILTLTVTDTNGTGLVGTKTTPVTIGQTATTISVWPSTQTVQTGAANAKTFSATVRDQFGNVIAGQAVNWSVSGVGSGTSSPANPTASITFTGTTPGAATLTAQLPGASNGTSALTIIAAGPFFVTPPAFIDIFRTTATVSALGDDNVDGEPSLTYTWALVSGPEAISVVPNGTNAAKNAVVTFGQKGSYVLSCTIQNSNGALADNASGVVNQFLSGITVTPNNVTINISDNQVFTAHGADQFGDTMILGGVAWGSTGGNVNGSGQFSSSALGSNIRVTATQGSISGFASVNVINFDVSGAYAFPVPFKSTLSSAVTFTGLGSSAKIRIYTTTGREVMSAESTSGVYNWPVTNSSGEKVASGVYLYVIESPTTTKHGKLIIIQ